MKAGLEISLLATSGKLIQEKGTLLSRKHGQRTLFCVKQRFGRCVSRSLQRLPVHPENNVQCGRYCYVLPYVDMCVPECTCCKTVKSLVDNQPSFTTTPM